ncbi:RluA family pseudouridine synthase [Pseudoflavonifractor phocaeensis]|uniref:RluA family pseudouridine synthase n=1 Tax=Pseudoflavonifractor phocaeensis TaxID=1870988 RepID=UPI00195DB486|nr:RluA family pseudouridine synthase [Pseudoflavonifractor phocaeensis]MBM6926163.1 RluA family pseudouridine synthase [Pseudoflavonifractor phocaeensis]
MDKKNFLVEGEDTLLSFLLAHVAGKSRNSVKSMLTRGQVQVEGRTVTRHDHPLAPGQTVTLLPQGAGDGKAPFPVLYEDGRILVIDKPAGLLSMASDREKVRTAYRMATDYVRKSDPRRRIFIVHRLDRDTSGVLLFAKDEETKRAYQDNWDRLVTRRGYLAVVEGKPSRESDTVRTLLRENAAHKVYSVRSGGKEAVTHYTTLRAGKEYTLLEVDIATGRKNQIRAHLSELGCPVAGDKDYGAAADPLGRLCLHAHVLELADPFTGEPRTFRAPEPKGFRSLASGKAEGGDRR